MLSLVIPAIVALITVLILMPPFLKRMHEQGFLGKDMNKFDKPLVAELGGAVVFLGFSFGVFAAIFIATYLHFFTIELSLLLAGFCTIAMICFIGVIDDIIGWKKGIRQWQHALFPILAALPLMAIQVGETTMNLPLFGEVNLGIFYALIIIPIGITGASNAFNMLAGFNGLEAGQGIILTFVLTIIALLTGQTTAAILGIAMFGALIAFLKFNWFPAKIFGGDSLTLMVGANLAIMCIIGNMETIGVIIIGLFFVEFLIKAKHKFQSECFGIPNKKGTLSANPKGGSLTQVILKLGKGKLTEVQVVLIILGIQTLIGLIAIAYFFVRPILF
ncbi:MAG: glycosyltransferase 4 family protein [archaeon]|jgi:UDP-N-acetylglucosamine--dolichyl-phosphate N-acetylglucosaminephosphotransferase